MLGTVTAITRDAVTIHTYASPESGLEANTHIIELPSQLLIVDTQYGAPLAAEAAQFARGLGKPIARVYISHAHPDHFFGAAAFKAPVYALPGTSAAIAAMGETMLATNKALAGDFVPDHISAPTEPVAPGIEVIDGVTFEFIEIADSEADSILAIALPAEGVVLAQDVVYNNLHLYIAEKHFEGWKAAVEQLRARGFQTILPGHGAASGPEVYDFVLAYLDVAQTAVDEATGPADLKTRLVTSFPDAGGIGLLDIQNNYMFPNQ